MAKTINSPSLKLKGSKMDIEEWLKDTFTSKKQLILAPYHGGEAFTLETLPFEALEQICAYKPSPETSAIVGDHNADEYNAHRLAFINAHPDEKSTMEDSLRSFVHDAVLENLASNIHKGFATYFNPVDQQQLLLLDNRKIYSLDRTRIKSIEAKCKKLEAIAKKSEARAALPSTSSASNNKAPAPKPSVKEQPKASESTEHSKKTRARKEVNYREESENSTSSAESHTLERHTDDESELEGASDPGNKTPILTDHNTYPPLQIDPQQPPLGSSKVNLNY